jgi:hypothetical protein
MFRNGRLELPKLACHDRHSGIVEQVVFYHFRHLVL